MLKGIGFLILVCGSLLNFFACTPDGQNRQVDVLVIGGSTSGISAGIQSARMGVETLIVEETPWLGGMLTAAGVSATDGNHRLPSGIWNEFREHLRKHYGSEAALATGWVSNTQFEPHVGDSIFKAMAATEPKLSVIYGYHLTGIIKKGNKLTCAIFENDNKKRITFHSKAIIDATDLGDGLKLAGATYDLGMEARSATGEESAPETSNNIVQDLTWVAVLKDYGPGADKTIEKPSDYNPGLFTNCCSMGSDPNITNCDKMLDYGRLPNNKFMINWPRHGNDIFLNVVEMDREKRCEELKKARKHTLNFVYYIQNELGYRHIGLADDEFPTEDKLALVPYHREGRRLRGIVRLTVNHVLNIYEGKPLYRTGISVGDYPVDHHHACNPYAPEIRFPKVPSFNIPLGALIPEKIDGLIVADKAISVSNIINGSTRLQPIVLLTGQAAGMLAALSIMKHREIREVNIREVQEALLDAGAYLMPLSDVTTDDRAFQAIQRVASCGILKVKGEPGNWSNSTWFFPDSSVFVNEFTEGLRNYDYLVPSGEDTSELILQKASEILQTVNGKDLLPDIKKNWGKFSDRELDFNLKLTKRELSVLTDYFLKPFEVKEIDFNGYVKH